MKHTTHKLTTEQKKYLLDTHKNLIHMIHSCGGFMLRRQIKALYHLLSGEDEMSIEFDISELILTGFLLQKTINRDTKTQMLYLSKYPRSLFLDMECSGDVPVIAWTNRKIFEQVFKMEYLILKVIPDMREQGFRMDIDNVLSYLGWHGSNLMLSSNQMDMVSFHNSLWNAFLEQGYIPSDDFFRDLEIAQYDKEIFEARQLKKEKEIPPCPAKIRRDKERDIYSSEIDKNKYFYSLKNFASHGFYVEDIQGKQINICFFDSMNNIQTKKLYQQLCYILFMLQRYLDDYRLELHASVYTWDKARAEHLECEENKTAFDFYHKEWTPENKKHQTMHDLGLPRQHWDSITVDYASMELFPKYNVHL